MREFKRNQMKQVAQYRDYLRQSPKLSMLFFELTNQCNLRCRHCGSNCTTEGEELQQADVEGVLSSLKGKKPMICLTGGEPMMHRDFFDIANSVYKKGFLWGMTTNATLIGPDEAIRLRKAGVATISVSLDGMENTHDDFRRVKGSWKKTVEGIVNLQKAGINPQVTTVLHSDNFEEAEKIYAFLCGLGIQSWRPINVEPIGRACESRNMMLSSEAFRRLISFIREKRFLPDAKMEVTFGCSHYLGLEQERMVRDHYFLCGAGILVGGVRSNGDICACLDIENRPELVQGNIAKDDFLDVWNHRFLPFRKDRTADSDICSACSERYICGGDSAHTWDYERNRPLLCTRDIMQG